MKHQRLYMVLILGLVLTNARSISPDVCVEIKDRTDSSSEIYTLLKSNDAILIGEIHGTNEAPQFVEGLVNLWLGSGEKVLLGLEINMDNQASIDSFIRSGEPEVLSRMPFFNRSLEDGRSSKAMADLIKSCYHKRGCKIICLDAPSSNAQMNRDSAMAACAISALRSNKGWKMISLTGNVHSKLEPGPFGYPMGYCLINLSQHKLGRKQVASLEIVSEGGTSWTCSGSSDCNIHAQGNYAGYFGVKSVYNDSYLTMGEKKYLFTKSFSASLPLNQVGKR
jgi:hypothetical protein